MSAPSTIDMKYLNTLFIISSLLIFLPGCSPEIGSEAWCINMEEKAKGDWSTNEAAAYAKHCFF